MTIGRIPTVGSSFLTFLFPLSSSSLLLLALVPKAAISTFSGVRFVPKPIALGRVVVSGFSNRPIKNLNLLSHSPFRRSEEEVRFLA